jgi:hypothetical protein
VEATQEPVTQRGIKGGLLMSLKLHHYPKDKKALLFPYPLDFHSNLIVMLHFPPQEWCQQRPTKIKDLRFRISFIIPKISRIP